MLSVYGCKKEPNFSNSPASYTNSQVVPIELNQIQLQFGFNDRSSLQQPQNSSNNNNTNMNNNNQLQTEVDMWLSASKQACLLGWSTALLFNHRNLLRGGIECLNLCTDQLPNPTGKGSLQIYI